MRPSSKPKRSNTFKGYRSGNSLLFKSVNIALTGKKYVRKSPTKNIISNSRKSGCLLSVIFIGCIWSYYVFVA